MIRPVTFAAVSAVLAACTPQPPTPPPAATGLPAAQEAALRAHVLLGCPAEGPAAPTLHTMPDGAQVLEAPCEAFAYQASTRFFRLNEDGSFELASLVDFADGVWSGATVGFNAELDPATGVLTTFAKAAGHGGCGTQARYRWSELGFTLEELRARGCSEPMPAETEEPPEFPVVFTAP